MRIFAGPSLAALLDLQLQLRAFHAHLPAITATLHLPYLAGRASDLSALVLTSNDAAGGGDARGTVPWALVARGALASADLGLPLHAAVPAVELFRDACDALEVRHCAGHTVRHGMGKTGSRCPP